MEILEQAKDHRRTFYVGPAEAPLAEMIFSLPGPGRMIVEHTEVSDALSGQGVGRKLVAHAVEYARAHQLKILPYCPFTRAVLEKTSAYHDVLL